MFNVFKKKQEVKIHEEVKKTIEYFCYEPLDMAWYIVKYCLDHKIEINMLKLQKLLYYVHVAILVERDGQSAINTKFKVTEYGTYNEVVYREYRKYSSDSLTSLPIKEVYEFENGLLTQKQVPYSIKFNACDKVIVDSVLNSYKDYTTFGLAQKTRSENPWVQTNQGSFIEDCLLLSYYKKNKDKIYGKAIA